MAAAGVVAGAAWRVSRWRAWRAAIFRTCRCPAPCRWSARPLVLLAAAVVASLLPAARAARVDVMQALRAE